MNPTEATLFYVHDPMCSWCWGFRPVWQQIKQQLADSIQLVSWVGGLAADSDVPMPQSMQQDIQQTWHRIQQKIPGTKFNFDFWKLNIPRRSTYPACRAVITARNLADKEEQMTLAIQQAYYLEARNPSDLDVLAQLAQSIGIDADAFNQTIGSVQLQHQFEQELDNVHQIGVYSFPSIVIKKDRQLHDIKLNYNSADIMLADIQQAIS